MSTETLLAERRKTHGDYRDHAAITQETLRLWMGTRNWSKLTDCQRETLHMEAHKIGRILTGDPNVKDHWDDMAGYATLISQQLGESDEKKRTEREAALQRQIDRAAPGAVTHVVLTAPDAGTTITNTDDIHDRYRRYAEANRSKGPIDTFYEWSAKLPSVPREDSNRHAFQEDGA